MLSKAICTACETWLMCLSFTLEVTRWPILGQLLGLQGHGNAGHQLWWHQFSQSRISRRKGCTQTALEPWSPWRLCEGSAGTGLFWGYHVPDPQLPEAHVTKRHVPVLEESRCSFFTLSSSWASPKRQIYFSPLLIMTKGIACKVYECPGSKENTQNTWVRRTSLNSHLPSFN